jgi:hypothetical protein
MKAKNTRFGRNSYLIAINRFCFLSQSESSWSEEIGAGEPLPDDQAMDMIERT